ncbi:MAG: xanthine dehydrogenase, partial [Clostridia bacterium]|nr:xanthine dehydrogenase [Clostridia bacterium]
MDYKYVGKPIPIRDALLKVTGKNIYTGDMKFPDMLHCKMLFSPVPHARIKNIDTRDAEKLPGVRAVATHLNSPQVYFNSAQRFVDHIIPEDELLFSPIVRYVGDRVAAV